MNDRSAKYIYILYLVLIVALLSLTILTVVTYKKYKEAPTVEIIEQIDNQSSLKKDSKNLDKEMKIDEFNKQIILKELDELPAKFPKVTTDKQAVLNFNLALFKFYTADGNNYQIGKNFDETIKMSYEDWEEQHSFIQWLFPLTEPSLHNNEATMLPHIRKLLEPKIRERMNIALDRFKGFLSNFEKMKGKDWLKRDNHNKLRITRVIKCLKAFNYTNELSNFFEVFLPTLYTKCGMDIEKCGSYHFYLDGAIN